MKGKQVGRLVEGVGVNDADYILSWCEEGKRKMCPYYRKWSSMLRRCYSNTRIELFPTYLEAEVCEEWKLFSNFKRWMIEEVDNNYSFLTIPEIRKLNLDKDIFEVGNKLYSPHHCMLVPSEINSLVTYTQSLRGDCPIGVSAKGNSFTAYCNIKSKKQHLGCFSTSQDAHKAWQFAKIKCIKENIKDTSHPKIIRGLELIILEIEEDILNGRETVRK